MSVHLTAGGACSDELVRAHSRRRPLPGLAQAGPHLQTSLDIQEKMESEKEHLTHHNQ